MRALNPVTSIFIYKRHTDAQRYRGKEPWRRSQEYGGREWNDAAVSRGNLEPPSKARKDPPLEPSEEARPC